MYYVTETQLKQILTAVRALPVNVQDFDTADAWVGLYLTVQSIASQSVPEKEEKTINEQIADD